MKPPRIRPTPPLPELRAGDRLTQEEFHRRYEAYPEDVRFELIGGVVYMGSPLYREHGTSSPRLNGVFFLYAAATVGIELAENMTAILGERSEAQPDLMLRLLTEYGGQSRYDERGCLRGAPELVAEISHTTRNLDLNKKKNDYLDAGVQEYVVVCVEEKEIHWFHFPSKRKLKANRDGIFKSRIYPGLWIDGPALFAGNSNQLIATVQKGIATQEHEEFVQLLTERRERKP